MLGKESLHWTAREMERGVERGMEIEKLLKEVADTMIRTDITAALSG